MTPQVMFIVKFVVSFLCIASTRQLTFVLMRAISQMWSKASLRWNVREVVGYLLGAVVTAALTPKPLASAIVSVVAMAVCVLVGHMAVAISRRSRHSS